jgi:hypothetical protein
MLSRLVYGPDGVVSSRLIVQGPFDGSQAEDESDRLLVYGTGGVAFGARGDFGNTFIGTTFGRPAFFTTDTVSNTAVGYAVGAGVEYVLDASLPHRLFDFCLLRYHAPALSCILRAIQRRHMRRVSIEIRTGDPKLLLMRIDPLPQLLGRGVSL